MRQGLLCWLVGCCLCLLIFIVVVLGFGLLVLVFCGFFVVWLVGWLFFFSSCISVVSVPGPGAGGDPCLGAAGASSYPATRGQRRLCTALLSTPPLLHQRPGVDTVAWISWIKYLVMNASRPSAPSVLGDPGIMGQTEKCDVKKP